MLLVGRLRRRSNGLDGGAVWGTAAKVIVRERRGGITLGVAVALVFVVSGVVVVFSVAVSVH
jgi:uncharacterized membrane protein (UPF0136 family)